MTQQVLHTTTGEFPLDEYRLRLGGREWTVLHTGLVLTREDEARFLTELIDRLPYGVALWPSAIALAHEIASRPSEFRGARVLELGAGTGLPGIVASSLGAEVVQTDRHLVAMSVCQKNADLNAAGGIEHRLADWTEWKDDDTYDWIIGSDILYGASLHGHLRAIFEHNLAESGRILLSDPFRGSSHSFLETLDGDDWTVSISKWSISGEAAPRPIAIVELKPPPLVIDSL